MAYIRGTVPDILYRASNYGTRLIDYLWGEKIRFWHVVEYPKSGGTWLSRMLSELLGVPFAQHSLLPLAMECLLHNHFLYQSTIKRNFYLYRDGRDVMTSLYFHRMRSFMQGDSSRTQAARNKLYKKIFGKSFDPMDSHKNLPQFIYHEMVKPMDCRTNWPDHIRSWINDGADSVSYISYESLLANPAVSLKRAMADFSVVDINHYFLDHVVNKYSFKSATGRDPGVEDRGSFLRKAQVGDWKNHFSQEAKEVFCEFAGDCLVKLEYEKNNDWVTQPYDGR